MNNLCLKIENFTKKYLQNLELLFLSQLTTLDTFKSYEKVWHRTTSKNKSWCDFVFPKRIKYEQVIWESSYKTKVYNVLKSQKAVIFIRDKVAIIKLNCMKKWVLKICK